MSEPLEGLYNLVGTGFRDVYVLILSDSTADQDAEWPTQFMERLGVLYPAHSVVEIRHDKDSLLWLAPVVRSSGSGDRTVTVWNGSNGGWSVNNHLDNKEIVCAGPTDTIDHIIIALGHNPPRDAEGYYELVDYALATHPAAALTLSTQNPWVEDDPWLGEGEGGTWDMVNDAATFYGVGLIDVYQAFIDLGDYSTHLTDNLHPNADGHQLWIELVETVWFAGKVDGMPQLNDAVLLWRRDRYTGIGPWPDLTTNGHDGTNSGAVYTAGIGWTFVSADADYIETPDAAAMDLAAGDSFTLLMRVTPTDATPGALQIYGRKGAGDDGYHMGQFTDGTLYVYISETTNTVEAYGPALADGVESVVALVRDVEAGTLTAWVDGVAGTPVSDTTTGTLHTADTFTIGGNVGASNLDGIISDAVFWRRALTGAELVEAGVALEAIERVPVVATPGILNDTVGRFWGFSVKEDAGAACVWEFRKGAVDGQVLFYLTLEADETETKVFPKFIPTEGGVYIKEVSGSASGVLYPES